MILANDPKVEKGERVQKGEEEAEASLLTSSGQTPTSRAVGTVAGTTPVADASASSSRNT